jgi:hypothetical protein
MDRITALGLSASALFAGVWIAASIVIDGSTFHFAPVIAAGAAPITTRDHRNTAAAAAGVFLALAAAVGLELGGRLDGPSLLPWGDASLETWLAALLGGVGGWVLARLGLTPRQSRGSSSAVAR